MKPGIKTTEFWLTLGISIAAVTMTQFEQADGTIAITVVAVLGAIHTILRHALKAKVSGN